MPHAKRIAELLINSGAVALRVDPPFTWTSGLKAPIYCDIRMIYSHPDARDFIVDAFISRINSLHHEPDVIAGTASAAIGWAALIADHMDLPFVYVRKEAKGHGMQKRIEGDLQNGKHVVLIEDLISTGGSSVSSVKALREESDAVVTDIVSIFTYELPASREAGQEAQVKIHTLSDFTTLLDVAVENGRLTRGDMGMVAEFAQNPKEWGSKVGV